MRPRYLFGLVCLFITSSAATSPVLSITPTTASGFRGDVLHFSGSFTNTGPSWTWYPTVISIGPLGPGDLRLTGFGVSEILGAPPILPGETRDYFLDILVESEAQPGVRHMLFGIFFDAGPERYHQYAQVSYNIEVLAPVAPPLVPEPATVVLLSGGLAGMLVRRLRRG